MKIDQMSISQLATKASNAKTQKTKTKYHLYVISNFSKDEYTKYINLFRDKILEKNPNYIGIDTIQR